MIENRLIDAVADRLQPEDFSDQFAGRIYSAIMLMAARGMIANPITLLPLLADDPALVDHPGFLAGLTGSGAAAIGARDFADQITELATRRRLVTGLGETITLACAATTTVAELVDAADAAIVGATIKHDPIHQPTGAECFDELIASYDNPVKGVTCRQIEVLDDVLGPIRPKQLIIGAGRPGMGKCQPDDASVLTPSGWRAIGDLAIGDELASRDGQPSRVAGIFPQGDRPMLMVTFSDGRQTECCAEHLWRVHHRKWAEPRVLETERLMDLLAQPQHRKRIWIDDYEGEHGHAVVVPIDPWLLGVLLGNGALSRSALCFSSNDNETISGVAAVVGSDSVVWAGQYDYRIRDKGATIAALRALGLAPQTSAHKFVPPVYLAADRATRLALLQGLMDTDGWAEKHRTIRYATASRQLADDVTYLVRSLGGQCSVRQRVTTYTYRGERHEGLPSFTCRIRHSDPSMLFRLKRKAARAAGGSATPRLTIVSIEPTRTAASRCIAVTHPERTYVTNDFIVTHNTALALSYSIGAARAGHGVLFVSLEMGSTELAGRMAADMCFDGQQGIPYEAIRDGALSRDQLARVCRARNEMADMPLQVVDAGHMTIGRLAMMVRRYKRRFAARGQSLDLVVVDYLQLLSSDARGRSNYETVSEVSRGLKAIAKEQSIGMLALAQLSREAEKRPDKRPIMPDLRDSGQIEQDADGILFLFRLEYYLRQAEPDADASDRMEWERSLAQAQGRIEFIVAKRRGGRVGTAMGRFLGHYQAVRS